MGDTVIKAVANVLTRKPARKVRRCRIGGEEIRCDQSPDRGSVGAAERLAEELRPASYGLQFATTGGRRFNAPSKLQYRSAVSVSTSTPPAKANKARLWQEQKRRTQLASRVA